MTQPALTIASLLSDPRLVKAATSWLKGERYCLEDLGSLSDPIAELLQRRDAFDVVLLQQGVTPPEALQGLRQQGVLLPAVVVGEVNGRVDYHEAEVHLPQDQLEQVVYSLDAAVSRFLRKGLSAQSESGSESASTPLAWRLPNRRQGRLGYLGVFYKRDPSLFLRNLPEPDHGELRQSLQRGYRDILISYFKDPAAANQAI